MAKIFVSIASYRDPELLPTLESLLTNAANPENLTIIDNKLRVNNLLCEKYKLEKFRRYKFYSYIKKKEVKIIC